MKQPIELEIQAKCQNLVNAINFIAIAALGGNLRLAREIIESAILDAEEIRARLHDATDVTDNEEEMK